MFIYLSMVQIGIKDEMKYATPLKPESNSDKLCDRPTDSSKITGAYCNELAMVNPLHYCSEYCTHVCDKIDTRQLLHELPTDTQKCSVEEPLRPILEQSQSASCSSRSFIFLVNSMLNFRHFFVDYWIRRFNRCRIQLQCPENMSCLFVFVVGNEPARRLGKDNDTHNSKNGEKDL